MASLRNSSANMEIGYEKVGHNYMLFAQVGNRKEFFGWLTMKSKGDRLLEILQKWDEAGGNDGGTE